ncbi:MAG: CsbD family protein [Chloroflexota bacterium]|nr:MAG: CsbD family protein [Chloroflexota bacterium]
MSQERPKGRFNEARGELEEDLGRAAGDHSAAWSGKVDQVKGSMQEKIGQAKLDTRRFADGLRTR